LWITGPPCGLHPTGLGASIMSESIDRCLSQVGHIHLQHAGMQAISKPSSNTIASIAESRTLSWLMKLVSLGDACNADTEAPPSSGHSSDCQLEVYSLPTAISVLSMPRTVLRTTPAGKGDRHSMRMSLLFPLLRAEQ